VIARAICRLAVLSAGEHLPLAGRPRKVCLARSRYVAVNPARRQVRQNRYVRRGVSRSGPISLTRIPVAPPRWPKHWGRQAPSRTPGRTRRDGPSRERESLTSLDAFEESRMKWTCWIAALVLCCGTVNADAGLFDCFGKKKHGCHDDGCCPSCAAPADCCPEPSCCAPACAPECCAPAACAPACAPTCCAPAAPTCCAPSACNMNECCPAAPSCCAPVAPECCAPAACAPECAPACDNGCTSNVCCKPKRKGCLSRLFSCFKRDRGHGCHSNDCCPEPSCCAPSCAAPCH